MYIPKHFDGSSDEKISQFLIKNNFGELVSQVQDKPFATHVPFHFDQERQKILLHVARANPQWQNLSDQSVLLIVNGPHGYISPSWYTNEGVPTWNFQSVHVYGAARILSQATDLAHIVDTLTLHEEKGFEQPWTSDYPESMLRGIVGIEISIEEIQCKFKLSQNRSEQEQKEVADKLDIQGNTALAEAMRRENNR